MQVPTALFGPTYAIDRAHALLEAGASGVFTFEGPHDVFAPLTLASTVAAYIRERVRGVSDRVCLYQPGPIPVDSLAEGVDSLRT